MTCPLAPLTGGKPGETGGKPGTGTCEEIGAVDGVALCRLPGAMMSELIVPQVQEWYAQNERRFAERLNKSRSSFHAPDDPMRGKIDIGIETPVVIGSVTFWNKGDVTAMALHKPSGRGIIIDDRSLTSSDNVNVLLESYFKTFMKLENEPIDKWAFRLPPNWSG